MDSMIFAFDDNNNNKRQFSADDIIFRGIKPFVSITDSVKMVRP